MNEEPLRKSGELKMPRAATVLIVDDDESIRELIDLIFAQEPGIYYAIAAGGANAIAKLAAGPPDVVLTDLVMPKVTGRDVVEYARKLYPGIPIIAFSAEPVGRAVEQTLLVGSQPVHYLAKPFDLGILVAMIRELAADRSWRQGPVPAANDGSLRPGAAVSQ